MDTTQHRAPASAVSQPQHADTGAVNAGDDAGFNGWLASSLELRFGLLVQYLRIDPLDADWREVFSPA